MIHLNKMILFVFILSAWPTTNSARAGICADLLDRWRTSRLQALQQRWQNRPFFVERKEGYFVYSEKSDPGGSELATRLGKRALQGALDALADAGYFNRSVPLNTHLEIAVIKIEMSYRRGDPDDDDDGRPSMKASCEIDRVWRGDGKILQYRDFGNGEAEIEMEWMNGRKQTVRIPRGSYLYAREPEVDPFPTRGLSLTAKSLLERGLND